MEPYVGEIRLFAGPYTPEGWALCNGAVLPVSDYQALFSLIGATYGGNGVSTFGLPNLQGRLAMGQGQGTGMTVRTVGQSPGTSAVTLTDAEMPAHTHTLQVTNTPGTQAEVVTGCAFHNMADISGYNTATYAPSTASPITDQPMNAGMITTAGGNGAHNNVMPCLGLRYIIALNGLYPTRP